MTLKDKVIILTGAVGGIGSATLDKFVSQGSKVLAVDLNKEKVEELVKKYDSKQVKGLAVNVTNYKEVVNMIDYAVDVFGTFDVIINNAGIVIGKPLLEHEPEKDFDPVIKVNLDGAYYGILAAGKKFVELKKSGVILVTSSVYAKMAAELSFSYNATKAAVDSMVKSAALEYGNHNIRVIGVAPGRVNTPMLQPLKDFGLLEHIEKETMRRKLTEPSEIAEVFAFLASKQSSCINGTTVAADDGYSSFKFPFNI